MEAITISREDIIEASRTKFLIAPKNEIFFEETVRCRV
jgi:hypothetical protein